MSVDRPGGAPLPVRLRFIPACPAEDAGAAAVADEPVSVSVCAPTPLRLCWPDRAAVDDGYGAPEYGVEVGTFSPSGREISPTGSLAKRCRRPLAWQSPRKSATIRSS